MVLLVVDTQKTIMNEELYNYEVFKNNIKTMIQVARVQHIEVIFVRHDDGVNNKLTKGKDGFEIVDDFKPLSNEFIFDKNVNSPFKDSGLLTYLRSKDVNEIIVVGLQTEYCIDATVKCAFEYGFDVYVPAYCNSTTHNNYMSKEESYRYYNEFIWKNRYAKCITLQEMIDHMTKNTE